MKYKFAIIPLNDIDYHFVIVSKEEFTILNEPIYRDTLKTKHHDGTVVIGYKEENGSYNLSTNQLSLPSNINHIIDSAKFQEREL